MVYLLIINKFQIPLYFSALFLIGLLRGSGSADIDAKGPDPENGSKEICIRAVEGDVDDVPFVFKGETRFTLTLRGKSSCMTSRIIPQLNHTRGKVLIKTGDESYKFLKGDTVRFTGRLVPEHQYANPGQIVNKDNNEQIYFSKVQSSEDFIIVKKRHSFYEPFLNKIRRKVTGLWIASLNNKSINEKYTRLAIALSLGQSKALLKNEKDQFKKTGTAHLLAVSGLHLGIVSMLTFALLNFILRRVYYLSAAYDVKKISAVISIPLITLFALLTGGNPPVIRALTMVLFAMGGILVGRKAISFNSLLFAGAFLITLNPLLFFSAGFQLSFFTVAGLLAVMKNYIKNGIIKSEAQNVIINFFEFLIHYFKILTATTFTATAITTPIIMFHFGSVSLVSPFVNLIAVPFVSILLMPLILIFELGMFILPDLISFTSYILSPLFKLLFKIVDIASIAPVLQIDNNMQGAIVFILSSAILFFLLKRRITSLVLIFIALIFFIISRLTIVPAFPQGTLCVDFLETGQGDSTLITFPDGAHWLVDAGGTAKKEIGKEHIFPVLKSLGVNKLQKIVLTHPDPDHLMGLPYIASRIKTDEIWENGQGIEEDANPVYYKLLKLAKKEGINIKRGNEICRRHKIHGAIVDVLHPCNYESSYNPSFSFNDNSIVLKITYKNKSILLTGDLSIEGEMELLSKEINLRADVLKLGHHGSRSSSSIDFLKEVNPKIAIGSMGPFNRYNFPSKDVVKRLKDLDVRFYRTDINGGVRVCIYNNELKILLSK
ncbi:MAG: DNA internalization-related competence protein ComEC/Rec2 [Deltaproteobacteria bacterium]|nr:DNA internalization-related competence protein ComEC/Rec2 [Deltaproteobacteria bacterium]